MKIKIDIAFRFFLIVVVSLVVSCASTKSSVEGEENFDTGQQLGLDPADPYEEYNRAIFAFNDWLDRNILLPVAKGYDYVTPKPVQRGIGNFFSNLTEPFSFVNNLIQGDIEGAGTTFFRFMTNTVFGLFGILDIATEVGMTKDQEDFGQTLGSWGVGQGSYLMLPFLGPSTTRDIFSYADRLYYNQYWPAENDIQKYSAIAINIIHGRAGLIEVEKSIIGDRYIFLRDAYLQRREHLTNDGAIEEDPFASEDDDEDFEDLDDEF